MFTIITNIDASFLLYLPPATTKTETALRISIERISCVIFIILARGSLKLFG